MNIHGLLRAARARIIPIAITISGETSQTTGRVSLKAKPGSITGSVGSTIFTFLPKSSLISIWTIPKCVRKSRISCGSGLIWALMVLERMSSISFPKKKVCPTVYLFCLQLMECLITRTALIFMNILLNFEKSVRIMTAFR